MKIDAFLAKHHFSATVDTAALLAEFNRQMDAGLEGRAASLAMIPAYVDVGKPVPTDSPIIVLDAGGTNLRVAVLWFDKNGKPRVEDFKKYPMPGTAGEKLGSGEFFDKVADLLTPVCKRAPNVGFCFSYPTEITPTLDGRLLRWTKQVEAPGVVGSMVGSGIAAALERKTGCRLGVRVLNDTVATLLAGKSAGISRQYSSYVGFILGTGTNIAYIEANDKIKKVKGLDPARSMVINVESGNFNGVPLSDFDDRLNATTADPGVGLFEKMISGAYIGGVGLAMLQAAAGDGLFSKPAAAAVLKIETLSTKDFDDFVANPFGQSGSLDAVPFTDDDRRTVMALGEALFIRAANLSAANLSAAVLRSRAGHDPLHPVCVTVDGSAYYKTRSAFFKSRVEQGLRDILGPQGLFFETLFVEDAPMIGAAVAGLIA